jgi:hypothetical protein
MVTLEGKANVLDPGNHIATSMSSALNLLPFDPNLIGNILLWVVHMCDMVSLNGKDNTLEPGNYIHISIFSALDLLTPNSTGNIFLPCVVRICDIVTLDGKNNILQPRNCIIQCT